MIADIDERLAEAWLWAQQLWETFIEATKIEAESLILAPGFISVLAIVGLGTVYFIVARR